MIWYNVGHVEYVTQLHTQDKHTSTYKTNTVQTCIIIFVAATTAWSTETYILNQTETYILNQTET